MGMKEIFNLLGISRRLEIRLVLYTMNRLATYVVCCKDIKSGRTYFNLAAKVCEIIL